MQPGKWFRPPLADEMNKRLAMQPTELKHIFKPECCIDYYGESNGEEVSMRNRNIRFLLSWLCVAVYVEIRSLRTQEDQVLGHRLVTCHFEDGDSLTIEACVGTRQAILVAVVAMHVESGEAIHALELTEAVQRHLACPRDELQELSTFFFVEGADCTPEPLDLRRGSLVVVVFGMVLPIVHVDIREAGNQELKFLFVEYRNELRRDNVMESC